MAPKKGKKGKAAEAAEPEHDPDWEKAREEAVAFAAAGQLPPLRGTWAVSISPPPPRPGL